MALADWILEQHAKGKAGLTHADFFEKEMEEEIRLNKRVKINEDLTEEQVDQNLKIVLNLLELTQKKQELDKQNTLEKISFQKEKKSLLEQIDKSTTLSNDKGLKRKALQL